MSRSQKTPVAKLARRSDMTEGRFLSSFCFSVYLYTAACHFISLLESGSSGTPLQRQKEGSALCIHTLRTSLDQCIKFKGSDSGQFL